MVERLMMIYVSRGVGRGSTELAAFDAALVGVGGADFNLIRLRSVIPPTSEIVESPRLPWADGGRWGDRLYAVYADQRTSVPGDQVWAGIGWARERDTGRGVFVEHGGGRERDVRQQIAASLRDMEAIRGLELGPVRTCVVGAMCTGDPTCALVIGGYETEPWPSVTDDDRPAGR